MIDTIAIVGSGRIEQQRIFVLCGHLEIGNDPLGRKLRQLIKFPLRT